MIIIRVLSRDYYHHYLCIYSYIAYVTYVCYIAYINLSKVKRVEENIIYILLRPFSFFFSVHRTTQMRGKIEIAERMAHVGLVWLCYSSGVLLFCLSLVTLRVCAGFRCIRVAIVMIIAVMKMVTVMLMVLSLKLITYE